MKKMMLLMCMLAMMMVAASPAIAQGSGPGIATSGEEVARQCQRVIASVDPDDYEQSGQAMAPLDQVVNFNGEFVSYSQCAEIVDQISAGGDAATVVNNVLGGDEIANLPQTGGPALLTLAGGLVTAGLGSLLLKRRLS